MPSKVPATQPVDVLVVGAGPAGCAAGILAARGGARVLVLDRARFPRAKTCGDAVSAKGAALIDVLAGISQVLTTVPHAVVDAGVAILPDGNRLGRRFGHEPGYIVPRLVLDDLLRALLERVSPRCRGPMKLVKIAREPDAIARALAAVGLGPPKTGPPRPRPALPGQRTFQFAA